jgi:hypothetical protein
MTRPVGDIVYVFKKARGLSYQVVVYKTGLSDRVAVKALVSALAEAGVTCVNVALPSVVQIGRKKFRNLVAAMDAVRDGGVIYVSSQKRYA